MNTIKALQCMDRETKAEVYLVGGYVRDFLRNKSNNDLDIVIRNMPLRDIKTFLSRFGKTKEVTLSKNGGATPVRIMLFKALNDDIEAQISLPRRGKKQIPGFRNTIRQDVRFRDFKINAMYLPINDMYKKSVIDLIGGRKDIAGRRISANGSANERLKESPIRMLRAISLASRTNYVIDKRLINAIRGQSKRISECPADAIRKEFNTILMSRKPSKYIFLLRKTGLLKYISQELDNCANLLQDDRYHKDDVLTHLAHTVDSCEMDLVMRLAGLLHDTGKAVAREEHKTDDGIKITFHKHEVFSVKLARNFLKRLNYDTATARKVLPLVKLHMYHYTREWSDSAVRKFIRRANIPKHFINEEKISEFPLFKLRSFERMGNERKGTPVTERQRDFEKRIIRVYKESTGLTIKALKIDGDVIMKTFNLKTGVQIGKILEFLLNQILERPSLNNRLDLLKLTTEYLYHNG